MEAAIAASPVLSGRLDDDLARLAQRRAHLGYGTAHPRIGLNLGAQQLPHHLVRSAGPFASLEDAHVGSDQKVAGAGIDQEQLFLDAEGDRKLLAGWERVVEGG